MKFSACAVAWCLGASPVAIAARFRHPRQGGSASVLAVKGASESSRRYGNPKCKCIGIDNIEGVTKVTINGAQYDYPADVGAHCAAWGDGRHPFNCSTEDQTPGKGKGWCAQKWCYIDPCHCDLPVPPKPSRFLTHAKFKGQPVFFSYKTCGGVDTYSKGYNALDLALVKNLCDKPVDEAVWGKKECMCVGMDGQPGTTNITTNGVELAYPADVGATCKAWDAGRHVECTGSGAKPDWCNKKWCFVDPCKCNLKQPPTSSTYIKGALFQGNPLFYSYEACGDTDTNTHRGGTSERPAVCDHHEPIMPPMPPMPDNFDHEAYNKDWHGEWQHGDFPNWKKTTRGV